MRQKNLKSILLDVLCIVFGTGIGALGVHLFTLPNEIAPGGVTGLATALSALTGMPMGGFVLLINIPLLLVGWRFLGRDFILKTFFSTLLFTLFTDVVFQPIPVYRGDTLLAALFGGGMLGVGMALNFIRNGSTGGTDILNRLLQRRFEHLSLGRLVLISDCAVVLFAAAVFGKPSSILYAGVTIVVGSRMLDRIICGLDVGKMVMIISDHCDLISAAVVQEIKRGGTLIAAKGAYSGKERNILLCALRNHEFYKVKRVVGRTDPDAFMIVSNVGEVFGEGFKQILG